jgi:hypothetical protein
MQEPGAVGERQGEAPLPTLANELWQLVVTYLKQETVVPIRGLVRFLLLGVAGSLALGVGLVLLLMSGLRALQTEFGTPFEDDWTWVPYLIILVASLLVAGLAARAIGSHKRRVAAKGTMTS